MNDLQGPRYTSAHEQSSCKTWSSSAIATLQWCTNCSKLSINTSEWHWRVSIDSLVNFKGIQLIYVGFNFFFVKKFLRLNSTFYISVIGTLSYGGSYKIIVVCPFVRLSLCPSVWHFSQKWLSSFFQFLVRW